MFKKLLAAIRSVLGRMIPYKSIESVERIETPISSEMQNALDLWYYMYLDESPWLSDGTKSLNIPAQICSELSRQILMEAKWTITAGVDEDGEAITNERTDYLSNEFNRLWKSLKNHLEHGLASGGMTIKPYPKNGHLYFDFTSAWEYFPISFADDGSLQDVIFRDIYQEGKVCYTRLERHTIKDGELVITQKAFKSNNKEYIGTEIPLSAVDRWSDLQEEVVIKDTDGQMFGWYKTASSNNIDIDSCLGVSIFSKSAKTIEEADRQYTRALWEYEAGEMRLFVDDTALKTDEKGNRDTPHGRDNLFRGLNAESDDLFREHSPSLRDAQYINGLNQILMRIEDQTGLSRGILSDVNASERTATELIINKQRSFSTIHANQMMLETCLKDVIRAMDVYATINNLAPQGDYEVSFEWDDSVITDTEQQLNENLTIYNAGAMGLVELRMRVFNETRKQATAKVQEAINEKTEMMAMMQQPQPMGDDE